MNIITFLLVISFLVFSHELGHFLAARFFKVKVYVFSIGFGKQIFAKEFKGTIWQFALIPLGGYIKMKGQDDTKPQLIDEGDDSYNNKPPWQRIIILFAGPFANFILAAILYFIVALLGVNSLSPTVGKVQKNSPAQNARIKIGDEIIKINNIEIKTWDDIGETIISAKGVLKFFIKRDGKIIIKNVNPHISNTQNIFKENIKKRMVGIGPAFKIVTIRYNLSSALIFAYNKTIESSKIIFLGIEKLIQGVIPSSEIGSVITISKVISDANKSSFAALLAITALISVNLGVLNLLPIPALDGGHIMFNIYEIVFKSKLNEKVFMYLTMFGWIILVSLMSLGIYNDINRLLNN